LLVAALASMALRAGTYTLSVPHYQANPGSVLLVPLLLDNAAGLAEIRVQLNFDPEVLELTGVSPGPLGGQFDMSHETGDGSVTIDFIRATPLESGAGRLAELRFLVNPGATTELYSDLTLARFEIGDDSGVRRLSATDTLATENGSIQVSLSASIDNASNGLPDWWELQNGLDPFISAITSDDDGDGIKNLLEYAFGGNPKTADHGLISPHIARNDFDGHSWWTVTFRRRKGSPSVRYILQESRDMVHWTSVDPDLRIVGPPVDIGEDMEQMTVRCLVDDDAPDSPSHWFMRIAVEPIP
jgi:hypothetical protein